MRNILFSIISGALLLSLRFKKVYADYEDKVNSIQIIQSAEVAIKSLIENDDIENFSE